MVWRVGRSRSKEKKEGGGAWRGKALTRRRTTIVCHDKCLLGVCCQLHLHAPQQLL